MTGPRTTMADGLDGIAPAEWNALAGASHPFVSHAYLNALEASGSAAAQTGWQASHVLLHADGHLCGALPMYRKHHSRGEFVFDFAWADACHRAGLRYYPKLLTAVPFTPVTGPRLLGENHAALLRAGLETMQEGEHLGWHVLFPRNSERELWKMHGFLSRMDVRFVWQDDDYGTFDGFLAALTHKRRKEIRRERRQVEESGVRFRVLQGTAAAARLDEIYRCYARTYLLRGQLPYLAPEFFERLCRMMGEQLVIFAGERDDGIVAAAICIRDAQTLYGRWWGSLADEPGLHFEACYYQGITYCLEQGIHRYDPGTQGEHKLARGFAPEPAWSMHRFNHAGLEAAVRGALAQETVMMQAYIDNCRRHLPFRRKV